MLVSDIHREGCRSQWSIQSASGIHDVFNSLSSCAIRLSLFSVSVCKFKGILQNSAKKERETSYETRISILVMRWICGLDSHVELGRPVLLDGEVPHLPLLLVWQSK